MTQKIAGHAWPMLLITVVLLSGLLLALAQAATAQARRIAKQVTVTSVVDPIPGHADHQIAILLPPMAGQLYTGTLTYTASKPVEVVVLHAYQAAKEPDAEHGNVLVVPFDGQHYAVSVMQFANEVKATNSATVVFTGSGVALHTLNGDKFTATASIQATQEPLSP
jgi:1-deoxy-D-xylulose 5-phosphate reductoisomerase